MASSKLKVAILIISQTAARDPSTDTCADILRDVFENEGANKWDIPESKIVPDSILDIQRAVTAWTDGSDPVNLIISSGGTGFAVNDHTPEAISPLIHKHAPGLVHGMLAASMAVTPFAVMSRPVAGVRNNTIIITLPGSPKGAKENLQSVLRLLPHACQQAAGGDSRTMHAGGVKKLEKEAGVTAKNVTTSESQSEDTAHKTQHSHQHQHHPHDHSHSHDHKHNHGSHAMPKAHTDVSDRPRQSNDPSQGPSRRYRSSPYPMLSVDEALGLISTHVPSSQSFPHAVNQSLVGHVLAADVKATESVPAFRASIVDGYAIIASSASKGTFPVVFASHAHGGAKIPELKQNEIARITTGAPLPPGANAVVMVEDTVLTSKTEDGQEEAEVEILTGDVVPGENVREIGSDVQAGSVVMRKGEGVTVTGGEFGLLASVGITEVQVYKKPIVGVLSTGDEIIQHDREGELQLGEVRDTNRPNLLTAVEASGFEVVDLGIASDKQTALESTLREALTKVDVLITTGGVSMGELDLLKPTIERSLGGTIHFGRVSMKPGKPTTFATVPAANIKNPASGVRGASVSSTAEKVIFSLPGNPASAVVTFMLFVLPALHKMSGVTPVGLPKLRVKLDSTVRCDAAREEYHRVALGVKQGEEGLWASSTGGQRSSRIGSFKGANALVKLPAGGGTLEKGSMVEALLMGQIGILQ